MDLPSTIRLTPYLLPLLILLAGGLRRETSGEIRQLFSTQRWSYWEAVLVVALATGINLLALSDMLPGRFRWARVVLMLVQALISLGAILALVRWKYGLPLSALGFRRRHAAYYVVWALTIVSSIVCLGSALGALIARGGSPFRPSETWELWSRLDDVIRLSPSALLISLVAALWITLVGPISEEVLFRGFLYPPCARRFGYAGAAIMTTAVWSISHGYGPVGMLKLVAMGLVFARVYRRTQSLLPTIALHIALSCTAVVVGWASIRKIVNVFPLLALASLVVFIPSVIMVFKLAPTNPDERFILFGAGRAAGQPAVRERDPS